MKGRCPRPTRRWGQNVNVEELSLESLDKQITEYYSQRWKGNKEVQDYTEVTYASGRVATTTN